MVETRVAKLELSTAYVITSARQCGNSAPAKVDSYSDAPLNQTERNEMPLGRHMKIDCDFKLKPQNKSNCEDTRMIESCSVMVPSRILKQSDVCLFAEDEVMLVLSLLYRTCRIMSC